MQFNIENCVSLVISELERIIIPFFEGPTLGKVPSEAPNSVHLESSTQQKTKNETT